MGSQHSIINKTECQLSIASFTYTQVHQHSFKEVILDPKKHGGNRDSSETRIINKDVAIACVCDGAGLNIYSEIAARIASNSFIENCCKFVENWKSNIPPLDEIKLLMRQALINTNEYLCSYKIQDNEGIFEKGGQTTLTSTLLFHYPLDYNSKQLCGKYYSITIGTGDSPAFIFNRKNDEQWKCLFFDEGDMLPFFGLKIDSSNIADPVIQEIQPDECVMVFSDGILSSFPSFNGSQSKNNVNSILPRIENIDLEIENIQTISKRMMIISKDSQKDSKTDPDDVSVASISFQTILDNNSNLKNLSTFETIDLTTEFYPDFITEVTLPWGKNV